jgi:hypothetical protein
VTPHRSAHLRGHPALGWSLVRAEELGVLAQALVTLLGVAGKIPAAGYQLLTVEVPRGGVQGELAT